MNPLEVQVQQLKNEGKAALARQDFECARDVLSEAIAIRVDSHKLYRLRSVAYACLQDYQSSLEDAEKVIALQPNSTDGYYHKGFALYHQKDYGGAAHSFQEGLKLNPSDRVLRQGFWDAITLLSQHRVCLPMRFQSDLPPVEGEGPRPGTPGTETSKEA
mmetsp:Transcript_30609/g.66803  ORF Transcript_30609/g.66803 Transcript_30609/m.66803 type:complete len:160 (+) Transcript_30609:139-618(+)|eukprot:CAMPEP_0118933880 /NCGR_PEP_ID=MMETSP1169-20130426/12824_1 /TAXON_ID=36882 /ORGANISM="Pyramimonas obovata, Strain CCMP722" /LENGTH=159 /DNA_ID=CAMNT_0006876703 /DNA_START=135 /DNA_END=614 /DNA_ORIENTATION=-